MQQDLLRFQTKQKYILFDLETCHLNLVNQTNKPWQIGYVLGQGKEIVDIISHHILWQPLNITLEAAKVTHFDEKEYLEKAEDPKLILDELEKYLYDPEYLIVGHNLLNFDVYIHNLWRLLLGRKSDYSYINRIFDTNALAKSLKLNVKPDKNENFTAFQYAMLHFKQKGLKTNLTTLGTEYKIDFDPTTLHNAKNDVALNWKIWNKMIFELEI